MLKVGMVGVGCISGIYLKNFKETFKDVELIAVCDLIRERAEKAQKLKDASRTKIPAVASSTDEKNREIEEWFEAKLNKHFGT